MRLACASVCVAALLTLKFTSSRESGILASPSLATVTAQHYSPIDDLSPTDDDVFGVDAADVEDDLSQYSDDWSALDPAAFSSSSLSSLDEAEIDSALADDAPDVQVQPKHAPPAAASAEGANSALHPNSIRVLKRSDSEKQNEIQPGSPRSPAINPPPFFDVSDLGSGFTAPAGLEGVSPTTSRSSSSQTLHPQMSGSPQQQQQLQHSIAPPAATPLIAVAPIPTVQQTPTNYFSDAQNIEEYKDILAQQTLELDEKMRLRQQSKHKVKPQKQQKQQQQHEAKPARGVAQPRAKAKPRLSKEAMQRLIELTTPPTLSEEAQKLMTPLKQFTREDMSEFWTQDHLFQAKVARGYHSVPRGGGRQPSAQKARAARGPTAHGLDHSARVQAKDQRRHQSTTSRRDPVEAVTPIDSSEVPMSSVLPSVSPSTSHLVGTSADQPSVLLGMSTSSLPERKQTRTRSRGSCIPGLLNCFGRSSRH